jgi:hypothetical protein
MGKRKIYTRTVIPEEEAMIIGYEVGQIVKLRVRKNLREIQSKIGVGYCIGNGAGLEGKVLEFQVLDTYRYPFTYTQNPHIIFCMQELERPVDYANEEILDEDN